jgi:hypothetical protein
MATEQVILDGIPSVARHQLYVANPLLPLPSSGLTRGSLGGGLEWGNSGGKGMDRQPVRVIVYAWGKPYVDRMLNHAVASLLAPGNLPALVELFDCTLVVVTEEKLFEYVDAHPLIARAKAVCPVRLIPLDDVIGEPWQYGISLAYALFRGFSDLGAAMTGTYLLFLNADFVLADGCYARLIPYMQRGERVLLSPSYCVVEEEVEPLLERIRADDNGIVAIPPRRMARMIIDHRHNTIRAKTISQQNIHFEYMDQAYWQADDDTIIGHQMPICLVAMRPETALEDINTFWDWGITYEFCPSRNLTVLGDSDQFLILELRSEATHRDLIRVGPITPSAAAARMTGYLTQYQLDNARFPLSLHAGALPHGIDEGRTRLRAFFEEVLRQLPAHVPDHRNHPQWIYHRWHLSRHIAASRLRARIRSLREDVRNGRVKTRRTQNGALMMLAATLAPRFAIIREQLNQNDANRRLAAPAIGQSEGAERALAEIADEFACQAEVLTRFFQEHGDRPVARWREEGEELQRELCTLEESWALSWNDLGYCGRTPNAVSATEHPDGSSPPRPGRLHNILRRLYVSIYGSVPHTRPWHPLHFICKDIARGLDDASFVGLHLLVVSGRHSIATSWVDPARRQHLRISPTALLNGVLDAVAASVQFGFCVIGLERDDFRNIRKLYRAVLPHMLPGGRVVTFWINYGCEAGEPVRQALVQTALMRDQGANVRFICSPAGWGGLDLVKAIRGNFPISTASLLLAATTKLSLRQLSGERLRVGPAITGNCLGLTIDIEVARPVREAPFAEGGKTLWDEAVPTGVTAE